MNQSKNSMSPAASDTALLAHTITAVQAAGRAVAARFNADARPSDRDEIGAAIAANDAVSLAVLRAALTAAHPAARWDDDEEGLGALPPGEWWVADPVEGAINHIHGLLDWGVTATLVRDNQPVLTAVHLPLSGDTYSAVRGAGAWLNGQPLRVSRKTALNSAVAGTGQAMPQEGSATYRRIGQSVNAMLEAALVVRVSVPSTLQLVQVAAGRQDIFWQYSQVRSGLLAGALLVSEAGGSVTDLHGAPWHAGSDALLASAPGLATDALAVLARSAA
jgi:myo-inositol-1(or 4)-monophosphatase